MNHVPEIERELAVDAALVAITDADVVAAAREPVAGEVSDAVVEEAAECVVDAPQVMRKLAAAMPADELLAAATGGGAEVREVLVHHGDELSEIERSLYYVLEADRDDDAEDAGGDDEDAYLAILERAAAILFVPLERAAGAPA